MMRSLKKIPEDKQQVYAELVCQDNTGRLLTCLYISCVMMFLFLIQAFAMPSTPGITEYHNSFLYLVNLVISVVFIERIKRVLKPKAQATLQFVYVLYFVMWASLLTVLFFTIIDMIFPRISERA